MHLAMCPAAIALLAAVFATPLPLPPGSPALSEPDVVTLPAPPPVPSHAFFDWQNVALFSGVAAGRAFDYMSTRRFRAKHLKEWFLDDEKVDNKPLFISIEVAGAAVSVGASYLLHRTGHHRLERWVSIVHVAFATAGGLWNYSLPNGL
jgi:hypothetical protein